jgi:hypothetical protein
MPFVYTFKGRFKSFFDEPFPQLFKSAPGHPGSFGYHFVGIIFVCQYECLCAFPLLGVLFAFIDNISEDLFFFIG